MSCSGAPSFSCRRALSDQGASDTGEIVIRAVRLRWLLKDSARGVALTDEGFAWSVIVTMMTSEPRTIPPVMKRCLNSNHPYHRATRAQTHKVHHTTAATRHIEARQFLASLS